MNKRIFALTALAVAALPFSVSPSYAETTPQSAAQLAHLDTPLPGCAITYSPKVGDEADRVCLVAETPAQRAAQAKAEAARPGASAANCALDYYQNGPYGSAAWAEGGWQCVQGGISGYFYVPPSENDQASSWDSCASGIFYANQPGTSPSAQFRADSYGDFPLGAVPNDSLSSGYVAPNNC